MKASYFTAVLSLTCLSGLAEVPRPHGATHARSRFLMWCKSALQN